jgi:hypothetical protein
VALFTTAIDIMLRSIDVQRLTAEDVTDDAGHVPMKSPFANKPARPMPSASPTTPHGAQRLDH